MSSPVPAFGEADLSNCEREQIHLPGSIQPYGALLVLDEAAGLIVQASANAATFFSLDGDIIGRDIASLSAPLAARLREMLDEPLHRRPAAVRGWIGEPAIEVEAILHRPSDGGFIVEIERTEASVDLRKNLESSLQSILNAPSLRALCDATASLIKSLTGYDRVMVYRFDEVGHGEVFSEEKLPEHEPFLGNRYPASDIPQIARRLYVQNRIRLLVDVAYAPVPLTPRLSPFSGRDLDMSMCGLRSMSPIHLQYLKNMGVRATLVISLVVGGELWGLIACHNDSPKFVPYETRATCEILAELVATRITALESAIQTQSELIIRRLEQRLVEAVARDGDWRLALFDGSLALLRSLGATGAALICEGQIETTGEVPGTYQIREIAAWLDRKPEEAVHSTAALGSELDDFAPLIPIAAGVLATPVSATPGEYLIWFRPERIKTVTWGGDPEKPVIVGTDPMQLSPRLSFAQWHQVVEGTSDPWTPADKATARLIGATITDIVLQFRSVRLLIAQDQLDTLSRQVQQSEQPMIVANATGRVLLTNEAFESLLQPGHASLQRLEDLSDFFAEPIAMRRHIDALLRDDRPWRGEITMVALGGTTKPLSVRAEAVYAGPARKLGYMLHFNEIADRKAAEMARQDFRDGMIDRRMMHTTRLDQAGDRDYRTVLTAVVENAQLAALEVTYGVEAERVPRMLEAVRSSVTRTADLLERLLWHASDAEAHREP